MAKMREIDGLQTNKSRKGCLEELREKLAIDSMRRATLCNLEKEKLGFELHK